MYRYEVVSVECHMDNIGKTTGTERTVGTTVLKILSLHVLLVKNKGGRETVDVTIDEHEMFD